MFFEKFYCLLLGLYVASTIAQLVFWWVVMNKLARKTPPPSTCHPPPSTPCHPPFTLLLCARNEAENLRRNLPFVLAQQFDNDWELLVVDDASEDETPAVLTFFQAKNPARMRVLRIPQKTAAGKKHALAQGIRAAKFEHLLLTDADCRPASESWLFSMAEQFVANPATEIVLGYGPMNRSSSAIRRYETAFTASQYFSFALAGMPYMGVGRNLAFKREVFERVGGFASHAHIVSGDDDLFVNAAANSSNTALCLAPESFVFSEPPPNWTAWLGQKKRHLSASPAYRWQHKIILAVVAASQFGHYALVPALLWVGFSWKIVLGLFALRMISVWLNLGKTFRRMGEGDLIWEIPFFDVWMAFYHAVIVPWILLGKKQTRWR